MPLKTHWSLKETWTKWSNNYGNTILSNHRLGMCTRQRQQQAKKRHLAISSICVYAFCLDQLYSQNVIRSEYTYSTWHFVITQWGCTPCARISFPAVQVYSLYCTTVHYVSAGLAADAIYYTHSPFPMIPIRYVRPGWVNVPVVLHADKLCMSLALGYNTFWDLS